MLTTRPTEMSWSALGESLRGRLSLPGDDDWDECRRAWNLAGDQHPAAVAMIESAEDVAIVVRFARENGLRVAPQGTGHGASAMASLEDAVLLRTSRMRAVTIDRGRGGRGPRRARGGTTSRGPRRRTGWWASRARRTTWAWPATPLAAASAGWRAARASRRTA